MKPVTIRPIAVKRWSRYAASLILSSLTACALVLGISGMVHAQDKTGDKRFESLAETYDLQNQGVAAGQSRIIFYSPTTSSLPGAATPVNGTTTGVLVSSLTAGKDADNTDVGIAITGPVTATFGTAFYSLDGGATWRNLNTDAANASDTNALLLGSTARLWFAANPNINGTLGQTHMRLWDGTDGATSGNFKDISAAALTSASGAYSATTTTLAFSVANVNDAPTLTATVVGGTETVGTVSSVTAFSGAVAKAGGLSGGTVFDAADNIKALGLTVSGLQDGANETITVDGTTIALTAGTTGTTATNGMSFSVAVTSGTATVSLSKTAGVSMANIATLVNGISYSNTATTATEGDRVLTLTSLQDTGGTANGGVDTATLSLASTIHISPANTAPVANPTSVASTRLISADAVEVTITDNQSDARVANGTEVTYTLKFSQAIDASSLTASDLSVTNGNLVANSLTQVDATTWTVNATAAATGSAGLVLSIADGAYTSAGGTVGTGANAIQAVGSTIASAGAAIDGTPAIGAVPTGWTAVSGTNPDLQTAANGNGTVNTPVTNITGASTNGGSFMDFVSTGGSTIYAEAATTTLSGLTVGQTYTYGIEWQQYTSGVFAGGQLVITVDGVSQVYTSSGLTDGWQKVLFNFVATSTSTNLTVGVNGIADATGFDTVARGTIAVDSLTASQISAEAASVGISSVNIGGTAGADTLIGTDGNDKIALAGGGSDKVFAGAGNDIVNIDNASRSALVDPNTPNMVVDGGTGINALVYTTGGSGNPLIDLTDRSFITDGLSTTTAVQSKLRNFSTIDITGGTTAVNSTIKLDYAFINNISGASDNAATNLTDESRMLVINGDAGDVVQLVNLADWSVSANQSGESLAATYGSAYQFKTGRSYKEFKLNGATLFVDSTATVNTATATTTNTVVTGQGVSVQTLFGPSFTDVDSGQTFKGVAITNAGVSGDITAKGQYQISADGVSWTNLAAGLTDSTAIYAAPTALIRFVGKAGVELPNPQDLTVRLIDSSGLTGTSGTLTTGQTINASVNGGATAFSGNLVTLSNANVAPVSTDADGVIGGDPLGASTVPLTTTTITGSNGTYALGSNSVTVSGNVNSQTSNFDGVQGVFLGDGSTDETATYTFANKVSQLQINFSAMDNNSGGKEGMRLTINGVPYAFKASNLGTFTNTDAYTSATSTITPVISSDGLLLTPPSSTSSSTKGTIFINAADFPDGIQTIAITNDVISGTPNGSIYQVVAPATTATPAQTVQQLFGGVYSDANADAMSGVVVTSAGTSANVNGQSALGKYQFSSNNGTTWTDLAGGLTDSTSVFLAKTDLVRFVPLSTNTSSVAKQDLVVRLVDDSLVSGNFASGATVDASGTKNGGTTAISGNTVALSVANTAPVSTDADGVIGGDVLGASTEAATTFSGFTGNGTFTFASTTATVSGNTGTISGTNPTTGQTGLWLGDANADETATITFDKPQSQIYIDFENLSNNGTAVEFLNVFINGQAFKLTSAHFSKVVDGSTGASITPVLSADGFSVIDGSSGTDLNGRITIGAADFPNGITSVAIKDDWQSGAPVGTRVFVSAPVTTATVAQTVAQLFGGVYSDANADAMAGVVVTSAGTSANVNGPSALGKYQFSSNNGTTWTDLAGGLTDSTSVFLAKTDLVRFVPSSTNTSSTAKQALTVRLVDDSLVSGNFVSGATVNASTNGGSTAISGTTVSLGAVVAPVVLDLNRDGTVSYVDTVMDINHDGALDSTHWAAAQDGVLVWDKYHDGLVHDQSQYAFAQYGGSTDLTGLAAGFDSNHDGKLNAADAKFAEFKVWQDLNGNGVSDAGEVRSLADWGITEINLVSDGVVRTPAAGVHEAGRSTATLADGTTLLVADASFEHHTATAAELATHAIAQGDSVFKLSGGMSLDLSGVTQAAKLAALDLSADSAANTVKLTLADVLGTDAAQALASGSAVHQLKLTGDINDTAVFSANEWTHTGNVVTDNGHDYAVYNASNGAAAQLLVDQHMLVSHNG